MLNYQRNARRGFLSPAAVAPPADAITPEQVLRHHRSERGRYGGTGIDINGQEIWTGDEGPLFVQNQPWSSFHNILPARFIRLPGEY